MTTLPGDMLEANLAAAAAILVVMMIRKTVRRRLGAEAAYLLWSIVPVAMIATLIPSRTIEVATSTVPDALWNAALSPLAAALFLSVWGIGAVAMTVFMAHRQHSFLRDVEFGEAGPAVVGFFDPRIVTPRDFDQRFTPYEQKLILAHEGVHLERHDTRINALVAAMRCLFWFNPFIHLGALALRADQEVSCDAAVIDRRPRARRAYAETLLKTHLAARPLPVGCYWPTAAAHPLTERISMLTRSPVSDYRRLAAAVAVVALTAGGGFATWAAQPVRERPLPAFATTGVASGEPTEILVSFEPLTPGARLYEPANHNPGEDDTPYTRVKRPSGPPTASL